jgi:hypothetical protein
MWTSATGELFRRALLTGEPSNAGVPACPSGLAHGTMVDLVV